MIIYAAGIDWNEIIVFNSHSYKTVYFTSARKTPKKMKEKTMQLESIIIGRFPLLV